MNAKEPGNLGIPKGEPAKRALEAPNSMGKADDISRILFHSGSRLWRYRDKVRDPAKHSTGIYSLVASEPRDLLSLRPNTKAFVEIRYEIIKAMRYAGIGLARCD